MLRNYSLLLALFLISCTETNYHVKKFQKSRVIVLTDMLNEPDDSQTMVRLLIYANKFDIEGLIAVSSCHQFAGKKDLIEDRNNVHPEEIVKRIKAYSKVLPKLREHENNWPSEAFLLKKVGSGPAGYGMSDVGKGKSTSGSKLITQALLKEDDRPLYVCINAGANCLAQALIDLHEIADSSTFRNCIKKLRVYDDAGQDDAGAWIANTYPQIHYQRSQLQVFNFMSEKGPVTWDSTLTPGEGQHKWAAKHVQKKHGPLGELYPTRFKWKQPGIYHTLEGGGTSTWIGHVNHGLYVPEEMTWGGWGGRFENEKQKNILADQLKWADMVETENPFKPFYMYPQAKDNWTDPLTGIHYNDIGTPIYRWRKAYQNDFQARMDWCIEEYENANHNPVAAFGHDKSDGIIFITASPKERIELNAALSSDPDNDSLNFRWFIYPEAGSYRNEITIKDSSKPLTYISIPEDAINKQIHVILEVSDNNPIVSLFDYRRIVINTKN